MKILDIAIKDMKRSFRSAFALVFMFVIPLLVPALFYVMFGNGGGGEAEFEVPVTRVVIVNQDRGGPEFQQAMAAFPQAAQSDSLGALIAATLQSPEFADLLAVRLETDPAAARALVDSQEAGVALILPADFSARFSALDGQASLEFYQDPTLSIGPGIVKSILNQFMDGLSGARIAVDVVMARTGSSDPAVIGQVVGLYLASQPQGDPSAALLDVQVPVGQEAQGNPALAIVGLVMGAMLIFYAYYTGVATGAGILQEEEQLTLPRLFTTPTRPASILTGKFLGVLLTVTVQVLVLLLAARLVFRADWGSWQAVTLLAVSIVLNASAFGIFINSLLKNSKQGGAIYGGVLTITTWIGAMPIFLGFSGGANPVIDSISLSMPQGWITRMLIDGAGGAPLGAIALSALVTLAWTAAFFVIGVWRFQRRYA
jgi:ABC-2 type transport system permease protein